MPVSLAVSLAISSYTCTGMPHPVPGSKSLRILISGMQEPNILHPLGAFSFNHRYTEEQIVDADRDISIIF